MNALKMYCPQTLILPRSLLKLPTMYPPMLFTLLVKVSVNLSINSNFVR